MRRFLAAAAALRTSPKSGSSRFDKATSFSGGKQSLAGSGVFGALMLCLQAINPAFVINKLFLPPRPLFLGLSQNIRRTSLQRRLIKNFSFTNAMGRQKSFHLSCWGGHVAASACARVSSSSTALCADR